jgi:hypothetical protein
MTTADRELLALKRDLLLVRAAAERAQFAHQLDRFQGRTRGVRRAAGVLAGSPKLAGTPLLGAAANAIGFARRQPWVVPAVVTGVSKLSRSRTLRWALLLGIVVTAAWWISRTRESGAAVEESASDSPQENGGSPP